MDFKQPKNPPFPLEFVQWRIHRKGKCSDSPYADGGHMLGVFEVESALDGGVPGCRCHAYCLYCGKKMVYGSFLIHHQPAQIGVANVQTT